MLTLPAGRAEVQIRTLVQSEWANAYEGIGEVVGRGIRYNETHENANVRTLVDGMQTISTMIAEQEVFTDKMWQLDQGIKSLSPPTTAQQAEVLERIAPVFEQHERRYADSRAQVADMVEKLRVVQHYDHRTGGLRCEDMLSSSIAALATAVSLSSLPLMRRWSTGCNWK